MCKLALLVSRLCIESYTGNLLSLYNSNRSDLQFDNTSNYQSIVYFNTDIFLLSKGF